ncbi:Phosphoglycerate mutase [Tolypocladium capitatum]|uniref:Phosphoglycerate mutase n=1 Tax=Tolypocladium capitatum TaxID=45235 RepID=A0A2K3Q6R4_9HYPO|nr:Phosphoglycerate mutase [Tolypocladium capitatum]
MPPQIVLIRHAQALHNIDNDRAQDRSIPDPPLSDLGVRQCAALRASLAARFAGLSARDAAVLVSPMRRTLQTAALALDWLRDAGVAFEASADWQETSAAPCDTGSPVDQIAPSFPATDFGNVDPLWPDKTSRAAARYAYTRAAILARGRRCLDALHRRPEPVVFVVSHSAFLRLGVVGWWFFNGDYRVFEFADGELVDHEAGGRRRVVRQHEGTVAGGLGLSWTHTVELGSELPDEHAGDAVEQ